MHMRERRRSQACAPGPGPLLLLLLVLCPAWSCAQQEQPPQSSDNSSLLARTNCTTSGTTLHCTVFGASPLVNLTSVVAPGRRVVVLGSTNDSFNLTLDSSSPVFVDAGGKLELWNIQLGPVRFTTTPTDPLATLSLNIDGIVLSSDARLPASLVISSSRVLLECSDFNVLQSMVCMQGKSPGDVEVYQDSMNVSSFRAGGVEWRNVSVMSTCADSVPSPEVPCAVRAETDGGRLLDDLASLQARSFVNIQFVAAACLVLPPSRSTAPITANVTISGNNDAATALDVNLQPVVFSVRPGGSLTLSSLVILNMLPRFDKYPLGMLTAMMWFVDLNKDHPPADQLRVVDSTVLVPTREFSYLVTALDNPSISPAWTSGPDALFHEPPAVLSNASQLRMESASGSQGLWSGVSIMVLDFALGVRVKIVWTGLGSLLLPGEPVGNLVLPLVQPLDPLLDLFHFPAPLPDGQAVPHPIRTIMTQSVTLVRSSMVQPLQLPADLIVSGHPMRPELAIVDLQGLTCLPLSTLTGSPTGYVTIRDPSSAAAAGPTMYLRDLVLVNLQPIPDFDSELAGEEADYYDAMSNYTSLLWLFNMDRFTGADVTDTSSNASDVPLSPGSLVMDNVTLVLPVPEFRVFIQIVTGNLKYNIHPLAYQLVRQQMAQMEAAANRLGSHILYERAVGAVLLDNSSSGDLGTLTFPVFNWFGMTGTQVKFTSERPLAFTSPLLPVNASLWTVTRTALPSGPGPNSSDAPPPAAADPADAGLQGWMLGTVIAGAMLVAVVGAAAALWAVKSLQARRLRRSMDREGTCLSPSSSVKDKGSVDMELALGGGAGAGAAAVDAGAEDGAGQGCRGKVGSVSLAVVKTVDPDTPSEERTPGSFSSSSQRGSPTAEAEAPGGVARSPFEAVALGLAPMAVSAAAPEPGSRGRDRGPELGAAAAAAPSGGDGGRLDTGDLLAKIFGSADRVGGAAGPRFGLREPSSGSEATPTASLLRPCTTPAPTPTGSMLHEILRQMESLREELGSRCEEAPQWSIQGQLGKGAHGVVYKGTWRGLDVAIKRVIFQVMGDPVADAKRKTTLREAAINGTLDHPNIVTTYSHDMRPLNQMPLGRCAGVQPFADWQLFIIQEFCEGGSLFAAIQGGRFWGAGGPLLPAVLSVATDVAAGCAYIHSKNIIHGDLKPDNVLLKASGAAAPAADAAAGDAAAAAAAAPLTAKIADFGMSVRIMENRTHVSGVHHGTPLYIAPEILQEGRASTAADVYSFGIILWELFHGVSAWDHLVRVVGTPRKQGFPAFHPGLFTFDKCPLPAYGRLGRACLSSDPLERPTFMQVLEALQSIAEDVHQGTAAQCQDLGMGRIEGEPRCSPGRAAAAQCQDLGMGRTEGELSCSLQPRRAAAAERENVEQPPVEFSISGGIN